MKIRNPIGYRDNVTGLFHQTEPEWRCPLSSGAVLVVYKGAVSDGASIPRIFWPIVGPPFSRSFAAAYVHDQLYATQYTSRAAADGEFLSVLTRLNVSTIKRRAYYYAVRWCGWLPWGRMTRRHISQARTKARIEYA